MSASMRTAAGRAGSRRVCALLALAAGLLAPALAPGDAPARPKAPVQLRDTATATGDSLTADTFSAYAIDIDASIGPGEDPRGTASFEASSLRWLFSGPVSCLKVTGNVAILEINGPFPAPGFLSMIIRLTDNGGGGRDLFEYYPVLPEVGQDFDCETSAPGWFGGPLVGRAVVHDAPPGPTSRRDCRHGGWARYGFKSRRQCFNFVRRQAR